MFVNVYANPDNYDCIFTFYVSVKKHVYVFPITKYLYRINETKKKKKKNCNSSSQNHFYKLQNKIHNHHVHPRFSNYTIFTIYIFPLNPLS